MMPRRRTTPGSTDPPAPRRRLRCAIYTRKSSEEGLEQDFNSLAAQREACEAYIRSQAHEGWQALPTRFDDGGFSGGTLERPGLQALLGAIKARRVDIVVLYKIDRLSRSLLDFAQLAEVFDAHQVSFVSVTQPFNTTTSMGRLMLNVLLSFAQFEREITGERIRDKIAASKQKGLWMGGHVPFGYRATGRTLVPDPAEAETVRTLYRLYLEHGSVRLVHAEALRLGLTTRQRTWSDGRITGGAAFSRGHLYRVLNNPLYAGRIPHKGQSYPGGHPALVPIETWQQVQTQLADHTRSQQRGPHTRHSSLLAGLLVAGDGRRFRVTQGVKRRRTYYYYSHPAVVTGDHTSPVPIRHVPAAAVDTAVLNALDHLLRDPVALSSALPDDGDTISRHVSHPVGERLRKRLTHKTAERDQILRLLVLRIVLTPESLCLEINRHGLHQALGGKPPAPGAAESAAPHQIMVPVALRSRQGVMRLVFAPASTRTAPGIDRALIRTVARAFHWWEQIERGHYLSIQALAKAEGVSGSYLTRVLRLAFLSPAMISAIVRGEQPRSLSARQLINGPPLPSDWASQQQALAERFPES